MSGRVAVIGGGIAGLAAAHEAVGRGFEVVLFEAGARLGGMIHTTPFAGHPGIDEGADAFLARVPWATILAGAAGLGDTLVSPATGRAAVWWDRMHPIPDSLMGMPTRLGPFARSGLLPLSAKLRAATEPLRPCTPIGGDSLGAFVRARFGDAVHERLVDPLVGSIYAADTDRFSLAAVPQIAELAAAHRSMLLAARRRPPAPTGPVFFAPRAGMGALVEHVGASVVAGGGSVRLSTKVEELTPDGGRWRVDGERFDAMVVACPAGAAARLLGAGAGEAAAGLTTITAADVALVTVALPPGALPERLAGLSGYLVPKPVQGDVTAVSFGSQKWAHWALPDGGSVLRISLGRDGVPVLHRDDSDLVDAALADAGRHMAVELQPSEVRVSRWRGAFPQYRPHHQRTVEAIAAALPPGLTLAGASYHGIGVPACVRSGNEAAASACFHVTDLAQ